MDNLQQFACIGVGMILGAAGAFLLVVLCDHFYPRRGS